MSRPTVASYMTRDPVTFAPGLEVTQAVTRLLRANISGAPVVDDAGALVGMFTAKDCFKAVLHASYHQELGGRVADFMSSPVVSIDADLGIIAAAEQFLHSSYRRFPVTRDGALVGVISRLDLLRAFTSEW